TDTTCYCSLRRSPYTTTTTFPYTTLFRSVETIRIGLAKLLPGRVIADVWHDWQKSFPNAPADVARFMINAKIELVRRRAKVLIIDRKSTRLNSSHSQISYAVFCLKKKRT